VSTITGIYTYEYVQVMVSKGGRHIVAALSVRPVDRPSGTLSGK